ncbi:MAG: hypothetical protein KDC38_19260 [Planctomycetes bacterium]|nr:hypothetical protein [Planctomycetota bacterium]
MQPRKRRSLFLFGLLALLVGAVLSVTITNYSDLAYVDTHAMLFEADDSLWVHQYRVKRWDWLPGPRREIRHPAFERIRGRLLQAQICDETGRPMRALTEADLLDLLRGDDGPTVLVVYWRLPSRSHVAIRPTSS